MPVQAQVAPGPARVRLDSLYQAVRGVYSGDSAYQTVAYVERFWRLPGNSGFNASIKRVTDLLDRAGYLPEAQAPAGSTLVYRLERRPLTAPAWEPVGGSLRLTGRDTPLLVFGSNRNMIAINSFSTPAGGVEAEVVSVGPGRPEDFEGRDLTGKIVYGEGGVGRLFREAVQRRGALGVLAYAMPAYTQPQTNRTSIQFSAIPYDSTRKSWGILLSYAAREQLVSALGRGPVRARVELSTRLTPSEELTLVATVRGRRAPREQFVVSAHVQEPGANDNASGVGVAAEMARTLAALIRAGRPAPARSIVFLWGDEIRATQRYLQESAARGDSVKWGLSLDMVGEDTSKTGGTFLIEKMPDPSAVWTRGADKHTEWGGEPMTADRLTPHYFNDFALDRALDQAAVTGWVVRTNPYEGGSDHTPFLSAGKPGLLFWHFTDQFYHTDNDRIDKVSPVTLANVGITALAVSMTLASADSLTAELIVNETERAGLERLRAEFDLSREALKGGRGDRGQEEEILRTWTEWYVGAVRSAADLEIGGPSAGTRERIERAATALTRAGANYLARLGT